MRQRPLITDWLALAALIALGMAAYSPFMAGLMPLSADGTLHLYRLITLEHALADGTLWARYVPGMVYGYGSPLFNYYSPLSLYPSLMLMYMGMSALHAWLAGMILFSALAVIGAFLWGRALGGVSAGVIAGVAYLYAPYTLFDAVGRGTISELASLAVLPWILWALWRLALYRTRRDFVAVAVLYALFVPLHNVITLHASVLIGIYTLFLWGYSGSLKPGLPVRPALLTAGALVLGMALSAFFWLPAITETGYVKIDAITANLPEIDVTRNLTTIDTLFTPPVTADPTQLQPPTPISLGWLQVALGGVAVGLALRARADRWARGFVALGVALIVALGFMNLHASAPLWDVLPLIRYSQFPWRLVGLMSLLLAALAGIGVAWLLPWLRPSARLALTVGGCVAMALYGLPWSYAFPLADLDPRGIVAAQDYERESGYIGTSSFAEYVPVWSRELPDAERLIPRYVQGDIIPRLLPPSGVTLTAQTWRHTWGRLDLIAADDTDLVFDWFYFPGWWASLDGQLVPVSPTEPHGLVTVRVPAGAHTLEIGLGRTDRQAFAEVLSLLAALCLVGVLFVRPIWRGADAGVRIVALVEESLSPVEARRLLVACLIAGAGLFAFKALVIDTTDNPLRRERFRDGVAAGLMYPTQTRFSDGIELLGYDLPRDVVESGGGLALNLYWGLSGGRITRDYTSVVTLTDAQGVVVAQWLEWQPAGIATSNWLPGGYVQERRRLTLPTHLVPGRYRLSVSLYDPQSGQSLDALNAAGNPEGVAVELEPLTVTRPARVDPRDEPALARAGGLSLLAVDGIPHTATVGQEVVVRALWRLDDTPLTDPITWRLVWQSDDGARIVENAQKPPTFGYPLSEWRAGDIWQGVTPLYVPGDLETGVYRVVLALGGESLQLGEVTVTAPERTYQLPPERAGQIEPAGVTWGNGIELIGYALESDRLALYWRASATLDAPLRVFVHVVDASGERLLQVVDRVPADWSRPVTGWAAGEVISDTYTLDLSAGEQVRIGWYTPLDGVRVRLAGGSAETFDIPITR